ncbi:MAG TPA: hypothetical protein VI643_02715 [Planctomycetota bacterium]|nr:hypothetical protein [Planctomycetota bacterium]
MNEIPVTCGVCLTAFAAKRELAGKPTRCPICEQPVQVPTFEEEFDPDAPPQVLELQERTEDKGGNRKPKPSPAIRGVRGKKGFGRALVGPGMRPKRFSAADPHEKAQRRHNLTQLVFFLLLGVGVIVVGVVLLKGTKPMEDRLTGIEAEGDRFAKAFAAMDAPTLAAYHVPPEQRGEVQAYYLDAFSKVQIRMIKYEVHPEWEGSHQKVKALVRYVWTVEYLDMTTGKREIRDEKRRMHWDYDASRGWKTRTVLNLPVDLYGKLPPGG